MFVLSQTLCFTVTHSVVMLNSTFGNERWAFPRYFEYNIERGPGNSRVEWMFTHRACGSLWQNPPSAQLRTTRPHVVNGAESTTFVHSPRDSTADALALPVSYVSLAHAGTPTRQISCTLDCRPHRRLRFRMALGVNLLPHRATILILTGTSDIDAGRLLLKTLCLLRLASRVHCLRP